MIRYLTFENGTKVSRMAHEHVTIAFHTNGTLAARTKTVTEGAHMRDGYVACGTHGTWATGHRWVEFDTHCAAFDMVSIALQRLGYTVIGCNANDTDCGTINVLVSNGRITDPDSIRGLGRNKDLQADQASAARKRNGNALMRFGASTHMER